MDDGCPALLGYVAATAKQTADVILESDREDPVLSTWQYGLGRTVAWNSDGNNEWTAQYAAWDNYPMLWSNIINYVISDSELGDDDLEVVKEGNTASITYQTKDYDKDTKVKAVVTDENGNAKEVALDAVKPGVFGTDLDVSEVGVYSVSIRKMSGGEIVKNYNTAYANQYSAEYQFSDSNTDLAFFVKQAAGQEITLSDNIWKQNQNTVKSRVSLTVPLLVLAIFLFLLDIIIRRFSIDLWGNVKGFWKKITGKTKESGIRVSVQKETMRKEKAQRPEEQEQKQEKKQEKEEKPSAEKGQKPGAPDKLDMNQLLKKKRERE